MYVGHLTLSLLVSPSPNPHVYHNNLVLQEEEIFSIDSEESQAHRRCQLPGFLGAGRASHQAVTPSGRPRSWPGARLATSP